MNESDVIAKLNDFYSADRYTEAEALLNSSVSSVSADERAYWLGILALAQGRPTSEGKRLLIEAQHENPHHWRALFQLGRLAEKEGNSVTAVRWYRACLDEMPSHEGALKGLARLGVPNPAAQSARFEDRRPTAATESAGVSLNPAEQQQRLEEEYSVPTSVWEPDGRRSLRSHPSIWWACGFGVLSVGVAMLVPSLTKSMAEGIVTVVRERAGRTWSLAIALGDSLYDSATAVTVISASALAILALCCLIVALVSSARTRYIISDVDVRVRSGVLATVSSQLLYYNVTDVLFEQPFPLILLNTGRITLRGEEGQVAQIWGFGSVSRMLDLSDRIRTRAAIVRGAVKKTFR